MNKVQDQFGLFKPNETDGKQRQQKCITIDFLLMTNLSVIIFTLNPSKQSSEMSSPIKFFCFGKYRAIH
jgi:hypothetical protein